MILDELQSNKVFQHSTELWKEDNDCILVNRGGDSILLNITLSIVWKLIDGKETTKSILDQLIVYYGENNDEIYLEQLLFEAINILSEMNIIKEK